MPTNRTPRGRARLPQITPEALALFREAESRRRKKWAFSDEAYELARMLGLVSEYWAGCTPLDRSARPCHPQGYYAHDAFYRCRRIREALLRECAPPPGGGKFEGVVADGGLTG
jgi:hypothetical protein